MRTAMRFVVIFLAIMLAWCCATSYLRNDVADAHIKYWPIYQKQLPELW